MFCHCERKKQTNNKFQGHIEGSFADAGLVLWPFMPTDLFHIANFIVDIQILVIDMDYRLIVNTTVKLGRNFVGIGEVIVTFYSVPLRY